jgi:hypothetical protein
MVGRLREAVEAARPAPRPPPAAAAATCPNPMKSLSLGSRVASSLGRPPQLPAAGEASNNLTPNTHPLP